MSKGRIRRLERDLRLHVPPPCRTCGGVLPVEFLDEYVTDATPTAQAYYRNSIDDAPPTPPCPSCGARPYVIVAACHQPVIRPRGAPRPENGKAVTMTKEEAAAWRLARGEGPLKLMELLSE